MGSPVGFLLQLTLSVLGVLHDMIFDWEEYLRLAEYLRDNSKQECFAQEAALRSSVSRAYYAAFCYARKYAQDNDHYVRPSKDEHKELRTHFFAKGRKKIARQLETLVGLRNNCDYDDEVDNINNVLSTSLNLSREIILKLK